MDERWQNRFDLKDRLISTTDPIGRVVRIQYDTADQMITAVSPSGRLSRYSYDQRGKQARIEDPLGDVVAFTYDSEGNLVTLKDQRGHTITYIHDEMSRPTGVRNPLGQLTTVSYDAEGNMTLSTDRLGRRTSLTYDALNRVSNTNYDDAQVIQHYDAAGRMTRIEDTQSGSIEWLYDDANRLLAEITSGRTVSYAYNTAAQRISMTAADRSPVNYGYDNAGRLQTISQGTEVFTYNYDAISRRTRLQRPNGVTTNYAYDAVNRLTRLTHERTSIIEDLRYTYNVDDELITLTSLGSATTLPPSKSGAAADAANRIKNFGGASYTYDAHGQTTTKTDNQGTTNYRWDARGRLAEVALPNGERVSYGYDALGRRVSRTAGSANVQFVYDGSDVVLDQSSDGTSVDYLNGLGVDEKLRQSNGSSALYFLHDHLNSTIGFTNAQGEVVERQQYEAFGKSGGSSLSRYGYTGRERDNETGLIYYRARWYDPEVGRFISEDPIGFAGGMNLYGYVGNNPLTFSDPSGLYPPSHPYCQSLLRRIAALQAEINKKIGEMHDDNLGLPWRAPGDKLKPSGSRWGHQMIINMLKAKKAELEGYYAAYCNDDERPKKPKDCPAKEKEKEKKKAPQRIPGPSQSELDSYAEAARQNNLMWEKIALGGFLIAGVLTGGALFGAAAFGGGGAATAARLIPALAP